MTALYECEVHHQRSTPLSSEVRHRTYQWLVDLDRLPRLPVLLRPLASFRARDHMGDPDRSIRDNVHALLGEHGIDLTGGRVLMLAHARSAGHVFNPLSVFWCYSVHGQLECVVAEVHNTYRQRHCYLLRPDDRGRAVADKEFYVSPFHGVDGYYRMSLPEPGDRLRLTITLHGSTSQLRRESQSSPPSTFVATVRGVRKPATPGSLVLRVLRHPAATVRVSAHIRSHGIGLWLRGLRVMPRPRRRYSTVTEAEEFGTGNDNGCIRQQGDRK